jgi:hypothetical protein
MINAVSEVRSVPFALVVIIQVNPLIPLLSVLGWDNVPVRVVISRQKVGFHSLSNSPVCDSQGGCGEAVNL